MPKVFLGVGHGGSDPGAVANGWLEKELNLEIALACDEMLRQNGVETLLSRATDENDTLPEEIAECNAYAPDLALDIHNNAGGGDGAECWCYAGGGLSRTLAENLLEAVTTMTEQNSRGVKTRLSEDGSDWYGFIRETNAPAVIVECAFVDNPADMTVLDTPEERVAMGQALAAGILRTLGKPVQPAPPTAPPAPTTALYRVQVGAYRDEANARTMLQKLQQAGFIGFIRKDI